MNKLLFLYNPHAGSRKIKNSLTEILNVYVQAGWDAVVYPTQHSGDCIQKVQRDGMKYDRVVVAGGDGMLHELVNAVMQMKEKIPVGYIPAGTINDFASSHGIPKDIVGAAGISISDNLALLDTGKFNEEYFSYVAAFGIATHVAYATDQKLKNSFGSMAYLMEILKSIDLKHFEDASSHISITADQKTVVDIFIFGAVTNSLSVAGRNNFIHPDTVLNDGLLDGIFIKRPQTIAELERIKKGLFERDYSVPGIVCMQSKKFEILSEPMAWTLDGENGGKWDRAMIQVQESALQIAIPDKPDLEE